MRFHGKSIRRTMVALLIVPFAALSCIWLLTTVLSARDAARLSSLSPVVDDLSGPAQEALWAVQDERRAAIVFLADPRAPGAEDRRLDAERRATAAVDVFRSNAAGQGLRDDLGTGSEKRLDEALAALDRLSSVRRDVETQSLTRSAALQEYNGVVDPGFGFLSAVHDVGNVDLDRRGRAITQIVRAHESISREDALFAGALTAGSMTQRDMRTFTELVAERRTLYSANLSELPETDRRALAAYWKGAAAENLTALETAAVGAGAESAPRATTPEKWATATEAVFNGTDKLTVGAFHSYEARVDTLAGRAVTEAAVTGVLGLLALAVSVIVPMRIGRRLVRDLTALRKDAQNAADVRLPSLLRRLAAGEQVDVEAETPRRRYGEGEIGAVGQAVGTLQRAAVTSAVKQAGMRRDVSDVFVNIARRSQALLHRQLKLLDTMERRTADNAELADLFKLDHLTTRMRRHAEGLVILSGSAPSRQWRRPVPLLDVVRGAIAEVEDYERVEVGPLPEAAVQGPAVAGLIHLLAELIENATVFSPPMSPVEVTAELATGGMHGDGITLRITDQGLGMSEETLLDANLRLAETPEFALADTDRLGLFVVSRLASRLGLRVWLRRAERGGVTAEVEMQPALLDHSERLPPASTPGGMPRRPAPPPPAPAPAPPSAAGLPVRMPAQRTSGDLPVRGSGKAPGLPRRPDLSPAAAPVRVYDQHQRTRDAAPAAQQPQPAAQQAQSAGTEPRTGRAPLPRREPRRGTDRVKAAQVPAAETEERDADEVRNRMAALQRGWNRARTDHTDAETTQEGEGR
ncbi:sensor histidine kinase [Streptomyces sp. A7024]|uniref:histidine kinase n=1 Tax=Streptomyces coryli TaxID=1128680 RepID=A0A6G4TTN0_9ACTN|nr:nitrate- and nitrite sensing domain-containing protein [Streptomyces coryli]NGN62900.1 sensor histidine kinase [Streptomyces coryli]